MARSSEEQRPINDRVIIFVRVKVIEVKNMLLSREAVTWERRPSGNVVGWIDFDAEGADG